MRVLGLVVLILLGFSCHGSQPEHLSRIETELRVTFEGPDKDCDKPVTIDARLEPLLNDYLADARRLGPDHYPVERVVDIRSLVLVPLGSAELQNDSMRMGINRRVDCYDGKRIYNIYIADPETTPERHRLRGRNMLRQVVYHELAHTYFEHYNADPSAESTEVGIMAAITDDRALSDDEMEQRKFELFSPHSDYLQHLPARD